MAKSFVLGSASVELRADSRKLSRDVKRDLAKVGKVAGKRYEDGFEAEKVGRRIGERIRREAEKSSAKLRKNLLTTTKVAGGLAVAGAAVGGAFVGLAKKAIDSASALKVSADRAGVAVETYQELVQVGRDLSISQDRIADAMTEGTLRLGEYSTTLGGPAKEALAALGLEQDAQSGKLRDGAQLIKAYIKAMEGVRDPAQRAAIAAGLFGDEAGVEVARMADLGEKGLNDLISKVRESGRVLSEEAVNDADAASKAMARLGATIETNLTGALVQVAPEIEVIATALTDSLPGVIEWFASAVDGASDFLEKLNEVRGGIERIRDRTANGFRGRDVEDRRTDTLRTQFGRIRDERQELIEKLERGPSVWRTALGLDINEDSLRADIEKKTAQLIAIRNEVLSRGAFGESGIPLALEPEAAPASTSPERSRPSRRIAPSTTTASSAAPSRGDSIRNLGEPFLSAIEQTQAELEALNQLIADAETPMQRYMATLEGIATLEGNAALVQGVDPEVFAQGRMNAFMELAEGARTYEEALAMLRDSEAAGVLNPEQVTAARDALYEYFGVAQEVGASVNAMQERKVALQQRDLENQLALARAAGDETAIRRLEREIELMARKNELMGLGLSASDATTQATGEVDALDDAAKSGRFKASLESSFSSAMTAAANGDWKGALSSVLNSVFSSILGGIGGGGGGIGSALGGLFAGLFDGGGTIGSGQWGIVGERGPEIVRAGSRPVSVTSRADTAKLFAGRGSPPAMADAMGASQTGVQIIPSPYFDVVVDGRAAGVTNALAPQHSRAQIGKAQSKSQRKQARRLA